MLVEDVGENNLIDILTSVFRDTDGKVSRPYSSQNSDLDLKVGIGDDAAVLGFSNNTIVFTTDSLVEGVHFDTRTSDWRAIGWKAMAVNMSDIAAMGCVPTGFTVSLGLRRDIPVNFLKEMYCGMKDACNVFGGTIVGGDTVESDVMFISISMFGALENDAKQACEQKIMTRDSAQPGDKVAVTGTFGCAAAGLAVGFKDFKGTKFEIEDKILKHLRDAQNLPSPRVTEGVELLNSGVKAAMDSSDGLVEDLGKICESSEVGIRLRTDWIPVDDFLVKAFPERWLNLALSGGEDYELILAVEENKIEKINRKFPGMITVIGEVVENPQRVILLDQNNNENEINVKSWQHFSK